MNHDNDDDQVPDFYSFADQERAAQADADGWLRQQPPPPQSSSKSSSRKKKKSKASRHAEQEPWPSAPAGEQSTQAMRAASPVRAIGADDAGTTGMAAAMGTATAAFEGVALDEDEFSPDPAFTRPNDRRPSSPLLDLAEQPTPDDVLARPSLRQRTPSSPLGSPRPVFARPAAVIPSTSPPIRQRTNYGSPQTHRNSIDYVHAQSPPNANPTPISAAAPPPRQTFIEPAAPPHMPQPHYYGLPDLGFDFGRKKTQLNNPSGSGGQPAGSYGYCCRFDSLADSGDRASAIKAKDALLVGSEGALEVFRVLPSKVEVVGRLEGLRGSVIGATILPHTAIWDAAQALRPLVAVVVFGAVDEPAEIEGRAMSARRSSAPAPVRYQTSVEIYSLQTQRHISTLFESVPFVVGRPSLGDGAASMQSREDLVVTAHGRFIVLASGKSGEVFVFCDLAGLTGNGPDFRCVGKFWTSLQAPLESTSSRPGSANEPGQAAEDGRPKAGIPLFSLSQRWLALVPPSTSSHVSIQGFPALPDGNLNPPGLNSAGAPTQPPITSETTGVDAEDTWSRLTRQAAEGVVKYSQKGMDLGWQGWKELTNPTLQSGPSHGRSSSREHDAMFPPTKAPPGDPQRSTKEPAVVSIIDLEALMEAENTKAKYAPVPLASFALPGGCNYLSSSTNGLRLLTISRKGEISTIWDLSRACHGTIRPQLEHTRDENATSGPNVRQIHRIARSSPSVVSDCAWSRDDDCIAMLTGHGTVHLHEIPARSRRQRRSRAASGSQKAQATVSVSQGLSPPSSNAGFLGSIRSSWQQVSTQVNTIRSKSSASALGIPTSFAGFREATTSVGQAGGRAIAKGLSQGLSAARGGASDYWHSEDNKIRHSDLQYAMGPHLLQWIRHQGELYLAVACSGTVHVHPVHHAQRRKGDAVVSELRHDKYGQKHFTLPSIRTRADFDLDDDFANQSTPTSNHVHGFWSLRHPPQSDRGPGRKSSATQPPPPSQPNEVETNPPYCPFHIDPRIDIFAFETSPDDNDDEDDLSALPDATAHAFHRLGHGFVDEEPWLFGGDLPPSIKMNTHDESDDLTPHHHDRQAGRPRPRDADDLDSDIDIDLPETVQSIMTVRSAVDGEGDEEIRIHSQRSPRRLDRGEGFDGDGEGEREEFDAVPDYDSEGLR